MMGQHIHIISKSKATYWIIHSLYKSQAIIGTIHSHYNPVSCDHGILHLDCWSIKVFFLWGVLSALSFILWGFCPMALLSIFAFVCLPTSHEENVDFPPLYYVIMGSYTLIVGVLKYFLFLMVLSALSFILWGFCPMVLLSIFAFVCLPTWSHEENVDFPPLYHVIMGSYTLIVGVLKYFLLLGVLSTLSFILLGFCPMALLSILLFSVRPRDRMTRMLVVHPCIMWSWDRTLWLF